MLCVLSEVAGPKGITCSDFISTLNLSLLVTATVESVNFYAVQKDQNFVLVDSIRTELPIWAMAHSDTLLALLTKDFRLLFLDLNDGFKCRKNIKLDQRGQQQCLDGKATIVALDGCFLFHCFQSVVLIISIEDQPLARKRGRATEGYTIRSFSIGSVLVRSIRALLGTSKDSIVAILYRDYNLNFSLRYYEVNHALNKFKMVKQFKEFAEPIDQIMTPEVGGIVAFSTKHVFYFPGSDISYLELTNDSRDPRISVSYDNQTITSSLSTTIDNIMCTTNIDSSRSLLISNNGTAYVSLLQATSHRDSVAVLSLDLVELGKTTVPTSVHHLSGSLFFASSRLSQSLFFNVRSSAPHITVQKFMLSSPPILDMGLEKTKSTVQLLTCQGGTNSGEIRHYLDATVLLKPKEEPTTVGANANKLLMIYGDETRPIYGVYDVLGEIIGTVQFEKAKSGWLIAEATDNTNTSKLATPDFPAITRKQIFDKTGETKVSIIKSKLLPNGAYAYITQEGQLIFKHTGKFEHSKQLGEQEISLFDVQDLGDSHYILLVCFWDGSYCFLEADSEDFEICYSSKFSSGYGIADCALVYDKYRDKRTIWAIITSAQGELIQINFDWAKGTPRDSKTVVSNLGTFPLSIASGSDFTLLYHEDVALYLHFDEATEFFTPRPILKDNNISFTDVHILSSRSLAVLFGSKVFILSAFTDGAAFPVRTLFSDHLCIKISSVTERSSIVLCREYQANDQLFFLKLVDTVSMSELHRLPVGSEQVVDILSLPAASDIPKNSFAVLQNSHDNDIIKCYKLKKNRIIEVTSTVEGILDSSRLTLDSIALLNADELTFVLSGNLNFAVRLIPNGNKLTWEIIEPSVAQSRGYTLVAAIDDVAVFGDLSRGITLSRSTYKEGDETAMSISSLPIKLEYEPWFLSALETYKLDGGTHFFLGDSTGNFSSNIVEGNSVSTSYAFNIGQPVNVIKALPSSQPVSEERAIWPLVEPLVHQTGIIGTSDGGIYCVSHLISDETLDDLQPTLLKCQAELVANQEMLETQATKGVKFAAWTSKRDWTHLRIDDQGNNYSKPHIGLLDSMIMRRWLELDSNLRAYDQRGTASEEAFKSLKKSLKTCYKNKPLIQRLVYEASFRCT